ncbi:MAG: hypothetical protein IJ087_01120 [Eggerthellaceae bacterium]|nr:hypothetical protein [Eggerthellaceae bacterium]
MPKQNKAVRALVASIWVSVLAIAAVICCLGLQPGRCEALQLTAASTVSESQVVDRIEQSIKRHETWVYFGWDEKVPSSFVNRGYLKAITRKPGYLADVATGRKMTYVYSGTSYASGLKIEYNTAAQRKAISKTVRQITSKIKPGMSEVDKYRVLHDGLIRRTSYKRGAYEVSGPLGPSRRGNCYAYALSYVLLCKSAGLKAVYLGSPNDPMSHGWCGVKVKGKWYEIDPSWDDPIGGKSKTVSTKYFLRGRKYMKRLDYHHSISTAAPYEVTLNRADYKMKRS